MLTMPLTLEVPPYNQGVISFIAERHGAARGRWLPLTYGYAGTATVKYRLGAKAKVRFPEGSLMVEQPPSLRRCP